MGLRGFCVASLLLLLLCPSTAGAFCTATSGRIDTDVLGVGVVNPDLQSGDRLRDLRIQWVRTELPWNIIEPQRGVYNWTGVDALVAMMQKNGVQIDAIINHRPDWLTDGDDFARSLYRFSRAATLRYMPGGGFSRAMRRRDYGIRYWEIFNEPNLPGYGWLNSGDDPAGGVKLYAAALTAANAGIRSADAGAVIVLGGLSSDGMRADLFSKALLDEGVGDCFDVFAFHPYGWAGHFKVADDQIVGLLHQYNLTKRVWFDEYGTVDDSQRSQLLQQALTERKAADGLFWFSLQDWDSHLPYGLVDSEGRPRPAYAIMKNR